MTMTTRADLESVPGQDPTASLDFVGADLSKFRLRSEKYLSLLLALSRHSHLEKDILASLNSASSSSPRIAAPDWSSARHEFQIRAQTLQDIQLSSDDSTMVNIGEFLELLEDIARTIKRPPSLGNTMPAGVISTLDQQKIILLSAQVNHLQELILNSMVVLALKVLRHNEIMDSLSSDGPVLATPDISTESVYRNQLVLKIIKLADLRQSGTPYASAPGPLVESSLKVCLATCNVLDNVLLYVQKSFMQKSLLSFTAKRFNLFLDLRAQLRSLLRVSEELRQFVTKLVSWARSTDNVESSMGVSGAFHTVIETVKVFCDVAKDVNVIRGIQIESRRNVLDIHTFCSMALALPDVLKATQRGATGAADGKESARLLQALTTIMSTLRQASAKCLENDGVSFGLGFLPIIQNRPQPSIVGTIPDSSASTNTSYDINNSSTTSNSRSIPPNEFTTAPLPALRLLVPRTSSALGTNSPTPSGYSHSIYTIDSARRIDAEFFPYENDMGDGKYSTEDILLLRSDMDAGVYSDIGSEFGDDNASLRSLGMGSSVGGEGVLPWDMLGSAVCSGRWPEKGGGVDSEI